MKLATSRLPAGEPQIGAPMMNRPDRVTMPLEIADHPAITVNYRRYALIILTLIFTLNYVDRQLINILAEPIKRELALADWQVGIMTGYAFSLFYALSGIPIALFADRANRAGSGASAGIG